jgi:hypothetical protein
VKPRHVRFGSLADIGARPINVRFAPNSGHQTGPRYLRRSSSGSLAMLAAIRRASSRASSLAAMSALPPKAAIETPAVGASWSHVGSASWPRNDRGGPALLDRRPAGVRDRRAAPNIGLRFQTAGRCNSTWRVNAERATDFGTVTTMARWLTGLRS